MKYGVCICFDNIEDKTMFEIDMIMLSFPSSHCEC